MIVSVLCISRARKYTGTKMIQRFLASIYANTIDVSEIEILVRIDDDDTATAKTLERYPDVKVVVGPRLDGYRSVPQYYNELAAMAKGTWLGLFSDDLILETLGWDVILRDYERFTTHILKPQHPKVFGGNLTPILHSNLFKLLGHCGVFPADWWWDIVGSIIPLHVDIPIVIEHIGSGIDGDTVEGAWSNANHDESFDAKEANRTIGMILNARG